MFEMPSSIQVRTTDTARRIPLLAGGLAAAATLMLPAIADTGAGPQSKHKVPCKQAGPQIPCDQAGPQAPRDITDKAGSNSVSFAVAPPAADMNLCNLHLHRYAEHRAPGYTELESDGEHTGYICNGTSPTVNHPHPPHSPHPEDIDIAPGDTIEVHWVFTTCDVEPGPTLGGCITETCKDPQLRVEARVFNLTDDGSGADFNTYQYHGSGKITLPAASAPVQYLGSTTGSGYNDGSCSPFKVTWNVSSACMPLEIDTIKGWYGKNLFKESHSHGVRRLVTDKALLAPIQATSD